MTRDEYISMSRGEAELILSARDYKVLIEAIEKHGMVFFDYQCESGFFNGCCKAKNGEGKEGPVNLFYRSVKPIEFFYCPTKEIEPEEETTQPTIEETQILPPEEEKMVYLWAYHHLHEKKHAYRVKAISNVRNLSDIISATQDPGTYTYYWDGSDLRLETTEKSSRQI